MTSLRLVRFAGALALGLLALLRPAPAAATADPARWRGFNLLEKFTLRQNAPYREEDFRWIAELGFNFVRLPIDYRCYTERDDWLNFKESVLREIDDAITYGTRHGVHVCLNLHRAPGFCINPPAEPKDLWTDPEAQDAFVAHWAMLARRYRAIAPENLSFNLLNEPTRNTREAYLAVNRRAIEAIHREDPRRPVVVDGNNVGREPTSEFVALPHVIQATRGYHPGTISHYRANWVKGSDRWPTPRWPGPVVVGRLYGPSKPDLRSPLVLRGDFPAGTELAIRIHQLSSKARLQVRADSLPAGELLCDPRTQAAQWKPVPKDNGGWTYHEPVGERLFSVRLSAAARELALENIEGDWLIFSELRLQLPGRPAQTWETDQEWGRRQTTLDLATDGTLRAPAGTRSDQMLRDYLQPWIKIAGQGEQVFVGEFGCFNRTPHDVALAWMRNWLELWRDAGFGWAVWNFRGGFGILDSGRTDVAYEDWRGHKLDRRMLELLQEFSGRTSP
ncbi:MAG: cellulase family glycosylhydrolase [Verrucomicrobia bacterium]|nr:cellulase family glycosylhydrolase [Verrucomicrobiota bacterium]